MLPMGEFNKVQEIRNGILEPLPPGPDTIIAPIDLPAYQRISLISRGVVECMDRVTCDACPRLTPIGGKIAAFYELDITHGTPQYDTENPIGAFCQTEPGQFIPVPFKPKQ